MKKVLFTNIMKKIKEEIDIRPIYVFFCRECGNIFMADKEETNFNYHLETRETECPTCGCKVRGGAYIDA